MNKMPVRATLFAHQIAACETALDSFYTEKSRGYALLMEMGTGKSITSITIAGSLYLSKEINRLLIVAPLSIVGVWAEEFRKFADFLYSLKILCGTTSQKSEILRNMSGDELQVAVVNYDSVWRLEKEIMAWKPSLIICDEGHRLKSHTTNASKSLHKIGVKSDYRLLLTGTVITNKALDIFSQYMFLNPRIFGNSFYSFRNRYFESYGYGNYQFRLKKSMEDELMRRIHCIAYRATKAECLDLPSITDIIQTVELEPSAMKMYRNLVKESYTELGNGEVSAANILTKLLRLSQLTGGFLSKDDCPEVQSVSKAKLDALADIIENAQNEGQKIVVIARFTAEINAIKKMLDKAKIGYSAIDGSTKNRTEQVEQFQNNPDVSVFIGQIATAGLGITLTAASTLVFYSLDYSMSNFEQAKARIHRVGQTQPCTYIYLTAKGTVDAKILEALRSKADLAKMLIDDYRSNRNPFV